MHIYGLDWGNVSPVKVEMEMIRKGGFIEVQGQRYGEGLAHHYEAMRQLLWPRLDAHRWHNLCRDQILSNKVTVLMGCASSGKTHEASWIYLIEYLCFPQETCVLVSSTDMRGLRMRVWGEIAGLWQEAIDKYDFLPGHMLDSRMAITTDEMQDSDYSDRNIRDMRKSISGIPTIQSGKYVGLGKWAGIKQKRMRLIADEACFPLGTLVDTPSGLRQIQDIKSGDFVLNCLGKCRVRHLFKKKSQRMLRIKSKDGREILCTPTHPFLTPEGWKCACHLSVGQYMVSAYEAMQIMRKSVSTHKQGFTLQNMQRKSGDGEMQSMRNNVYKAIPINAEHFLQQVLLVEASSNRSKISKEVLYRTEKQENLEIQRGHICCQSRAIQRNGKKAIGWIETLQGFANGGTKTGITNREQQSCETAWISSKDSWRKWDWPNESGTYYSKSILARSEKQFSDSDTQKGGFWVSDMLQSGRCDTFNKTGDRGRWKFSLSDCTTITGCEENRFPLGDWVDSIEILEQEDSGGVRDGNIGIEVYNLEVEDHPSYSVNGFLVHNSMMGNSFLSAFANLNKNEDFRAIVIGNPNDPLDPLGKAAEPLDGWSSHLNPSKTEVWKTRFMNGVCVNLIGTDSPNFDYPASEPTRYKYLISREKIADTLSFFPKDSSEYYSQCVGCMKVGTLDDRIITRELCRNFGALEDVIWEGTEPIKVCALDAAYGGDRAVCGHVEFGESAGGQIVIAFNPPQIVPVVPNSSTSPEEQLAIWVKDYCDRNDIPASNFFHDSTGRGGLGTALARVWSAECNPVEFGGSATERPVSIGLYTYDMATQTRRLVQCNEHYDRLVSELWYQFRYAIESRQVRRLPEDVMDELAMRKWGRKTGNNKIRVETKEEMKERIGRSPDLGDWAALCLEGARRLGFVIEKIPGQSGQSKGNDDYLSIELTKYMMERKKHQLNYT